MTTLKLTQDELKAKAREILNQIKTTFADAEPGSEHHSVRGAAASNFVRGNYDRVIEIGSLYLK